MNTVDLWWSSLTIRQKERIAWKVTGQEIAYPACTSVWKELSDEKKQKIYDHCTSAHGLQMDDWKEGDPYGN